MRAVRFGATNVGSGGLRTLLSSNELDLSLTGVNGAAQLVAFTIRSHWVKATVRPG